MSEGIPYTVPLLHSDCVRTSTFFRHTFDQCLKSHNRILFHRASENGIRSTTAVRLRYRIVGSRERTAEPEGIMVASIMLALWAAMPERKVLTVESAARTIGE